MLACMECNRRKANRTPDEAHMALLKQPVKPRWSPLICASATAARIRTETG